MRAGIGIARDVAAAVLAVKPIALARDTPAPTSAPSDLGKELAFRFQPVGVRIARQLKSRAAFGNKIGANPNVLLSRRDGRHRLRAFHHFCFSGRLFCSGGGRFFATCRSLAGGFLVDLRVGHRGAGAGSFIFVLDNFAFFRHRLVPFEILNSITVDGTIRKWFLDVVLR